MIYWQNITIQIRTTILLSNINLKLAKGKSIGIIGNNNIGKTILAKALAGILPVISDMPQAKVDAVYMPFQSEFQLKHGTTAYRQQRWNWYDAEVVPTVKDEFSKLKNQHELQKLITLFEFENHLNLHVISLSNGEQRKFELIRVLAQKPDLLVIDNAFNGLDVASREILHKMLNQLIQQGQSVVLTGLKLDDFPEKMNDFIYINQNKKCISYKRETLPIIDTKELPDDLTIPRWNNAKFNEIFRINNSGFSIKNKAILKDISWTIKPGESWVLSGSNGSGKTSLLNLIFADNPKAYTCDISLFGSKKGSGESIWDIKNNIGFVSPEMHQYLPSRQKVNDVICSGFFVSEGLYHKPTSYQQNLAAQWLNTIGLKHFNNCQFGALSASTQRMVLVLRSLVRNPPLFILDEPFQGLDSYNIQIMKLLLRNISQHTNCAMIFVSHFEDDIPDTFNLELRLKEGKIEYIGERK